VLYHNEAEAWQRQFSAQQHPSGINVTENNFKPSGEETERKR
jgi:hypothetical protein